MATRTCNAKEKTRHTAIDLSPLDMVLGRPPYTRGPVKHWRRAGQTPLASDRAPMWRINDNGDLELK